MKRLAKRAKKILQKNAEDIGYLLLTGLPIGLFLILLSRVVTLGEVY
jgi:hypothetical protein